MVVTCALMDIRTYQAMDRTRRHRTLQFTFMSHQSQLVVFWKTLGCGAQFSVWKRSLLVVETMTLFSGLDTDVHFSGDETGLQWEDYLFELQNAVEWRMVMSRGQDERSQMHAMSLLLNTCDGMTNRVLTDD